MNSIMNETKMKVCSKCQMVLPACKEHFAKAKKGKFGFKSTCKSCDKIYRKKHYEENHEEIRRKQNAYLVKYHQENKESISEYKKKYYQENKEEILKKVKEYGFIYREENREKLSRKHKKYKRDNPEKIRVYKQKRRSLKKRLLSTLTVDQWEDTKKYFNNRCCYCGGDEKLTQDHFVPLSKNGEYTYHNIVPACTSCNLSKGDRLFHEWYPTFKHYSPQREEAVLKHLGYKNNKQQMALF